MDQHQAFQPNLADFVPQATISVQFPEEEDIFSLHGLQNTALMFQCLICQELIRKAHRLKCSHRFCGECIVPWSQENKKCPTCSHTFRIAKPDEFFDDLMKKVINCAFPLRFQVNQHSVLINLFQKKFLIRIFYPKREDYILSNGRVCMILNSIWVQKDPDDTPIMRRLMNNYVQKLKRGKERQHSQGDEVQIEIARQWLPPKKAGEKIQYSRDVDQF